MKLMNYQLSMNVNYLAHMCIHHPGKPMCQKIRPHSVERAHMSDVCAKLLSFTRAINYPNNIKENEDYVYTRRAPERCRGYLSGDDVHLSVMVIASTSFHHLFHTATSVWVHSDL